MALLLLRKKPIGEQMIAQRRGDHNREDEGPERRKGTDHGPAARFGAPGERVQGGLRASGIRIQDQERTSSFRNLESRDPNPFFVGRNREEETNRTRGKPRGDR
jgi:hypothetical protein